MRSYLRRALLFAPALLVTLFGAQMARAATLNVPSAQYPTIQAGINAAQTGDTVLVADGTYTGLGNVDLDFGGRNITVTSQHGAASTVINCGGYASSDGSGNHRGFYIHSGETRALVSGFTIKNGYTSMVSFDSRSGLGGGIYVDNSATLSGASSVITVANCIITTSAATLNGGGVYATSSASGGAITLSNCTLTANTAAGASGIEGDGGGIYTSTSGGKITLLNCTASANTANGWGNTRGDGGVYNTTSGGSITLTGCTVTANTAGIDGGVVNMAATNGSIALTNCTIAANTAIGYDGDPSALAGGLENYTTGGSITLTGCTVTANSGGIGGVINDTNGGSISMQGCGITGNSGTSNSGGGVLNSTNNGSIVLQDCAITGNSTTGYGGGVNNENYMGGTITLLHCAITNNTDTGDGGGGVYNEADASTGSITLQDCAITANTTANEGGGVETENFSNSSVALTNCTVTANTAGNSGGGIYNSNAYAGSITLTNCTLTANSASTVGGVENDNSNTGSIVLTNDILYGDSGGEVLNNGGGNAITYCDVQGGYYVSAGNFAANPLFVRAPNLSANPPDYGDLHLQNGSPCLGAGTPIGAPTTDADGNPRPNPPSIGAYDRSANVTRFDFNKDGHNDLVWHNTATGQALVWDMNDQTTLAAGSPFATVNPQWTIAAVADVNNDGHPDLLWENTQTGQLLFWLMGGTNGSQVLGYGPIFATVTDTHWHVVSMSDFNGDGKPDLLWENSATGQLTVWYMNGGQIASYGQVFATVSDTHWSVAGTADFNGDGKPDLLWRNSQSGQVLVWNMTGAQGTQVLSYGATLATLADPTWHIVGTGDTNGDGHPDIVWQNSRTGQVVRWLLGGTNGETVTQYGNAFATVADTHWQIVGVH